MAEETSAPLAESAVVRPAYDASPLAEMLADQPARLTRRFLHALLSVFCLAFVISAVLEIDVTVTAPAVLLPSGKALLIQPDEAGTVVALNVKEGDIVQAGDVLAELDSEKAGEQLVAVREAALKLDTALRALQVVLPEGRRLAEQEIGNLKEQIQLLQRERDQLQTKLKHEKQSNEFAVLAYREQVRKLEEAGARLGTDLTSSRENVSFRQKQVEVNERLLRAQAIGQIELLASRRDLAESQAAFERVLSQQRENQNDRLIAEKTQLKEEQQHLHRIAELSQLLERNSVQSRSAQLTILKQQNEQKMKLLDAETTERTARAELELARQRAEMTRSPRNRQFVTAVAEGKAAVSSRLLVVAPVNGRIGTVSIRRQGEGVQRGQTLMTLLPEGPLVAEMRIANRDVGLVKPGQRVKLKMDAFPYAEYGSVKAAITLVPPDAEGLDSPGQSFYRATAQLEAQQLQKHGGVVDLLAGMTASAEIVTERKTLLRFALTPLLEPFQN